MQTEFWDDAPHSRCAVLFVGVGINAMNGYLRTGGATLRELNEIASNSLVWHVSGWIPNFVQSIWGDCFR